MTVTTQPVKSHYTSNSKFHPMDSIFTKILFVNSLKEHFLPFVLWICTRFTVQLQVLNCNSFLFPNKPILLEKYLTLFKVNTTSVNNFVVPKNTVPILKRKTFRNIKQPWECGSVDWALACELKGHPFHSQAGHVLAHAWVVGQVPSWGCATGYISWCISCTLLFLSCPFFLPSLVK